MKFTNLFGGTRSRVQNRVDAESRVHSIRNMATIRATAILLGSLTWTIGFCANAVAETGSCGLETGIWASPREACRYARQPAEAIKQFGEDALLEWRLGSYRFEGANCTIFSDKLATGRCTLSVECSYQENRSVGEWSIEVQNAQTFRFGTRPASPIYYHCGTEDPSP